MQITVNGEPRELEDQATATALVEAMGLAGKRFAMEVNQEILPRSQHDSHALQPGDRVEIVQAIGGG